MMAIKFFGGGGKDFIAFFWTALCKMTEIEKT